MKIKYIVSVGSLVAMLSGPVMAGFVKEDFAGSQGDSLENYGQWRATSASVMVSNKTARVGGLGTTSAAIPILQTLSNVAALGASETNVWTDFWTIPRPLVSDAAPAVDINSSAMFFVTNTSWAVVYGAGGSDTNVCENDIWNDPHTVANDGSTWHRVSVLHNYTAKKWSLFVDGVPLKTNMAFISNVPNYQWFAVQNGGGAASNVTWIDEVLITNRVPSTLTADHDANGMYDAWEMMYFGSIGTASPTADADGDGFNNSQESKLGANPGVQSPNEPGGSNMMEYVFGTTAPGIVSLGPTNSSPDAMRLTFSIGAGRTCTVLGSPTRSSSFAPVGSSFNTGSAGETNWFVDANALVNARYYYRVTTTDTNGTGLVATNAVTYTFFRQSREVRPEGGGSNFWIGVVVDYGASNRLDSTLGTQLAQGLVEDDHLTVYYNGMTTFDFDGATWVKNGDGPIDVTTPIPLGVGMVIKRHGSTTGERSVFAGAMITNTTITLDLGLGWNMISWPFEGSNDINVASSGLTTAGSQNDYMWIYRNGVYKKVRRAASAWMMSGGGTVPADVRYIKFGEGVFYSNTVGTLTWSPSSP